MSEKTGRPYEVCETSCPGYMLKSKAGSSDICIYEDLMDPKAVRKGEECIVPGDWYRNTNLSKTSALERMRERNLS